VAPGYCGGQSGSGALPHSTPGIGTSLPHFATDELKEHSQGLTTRQELKNTSSAWLGNGPQQRWLLCAGIPEKLVFDPTLALTLVLPTEKIPELSLISYSTDALELVLIDRILRPIPHPASYFSEYLPDSLMPIRRDGQKEQHASNR
jgi:hypothetical protein